MEYKWASFDDFEEDWLKHKGREKFFGKMKAGLKSDNLQGDIYAAVDGNYRMGYIATKYFSGRYANLKWIMTVPGFRGKGAFRFMVEQSLKTAWDMDCKHYRVSINHPAIGAYQSLGFKYWGVQKSGCYLSIAQMNGPRLEDLTFEWDDYIEREVTKTGMGGCVNGWAKVAK